MERLDIGAEMQCRNCSQDVPLGAALCPHCGATQPKTERPPDPVRLPVSDEDQPSEADDERFGRLSGDLSQSVATARRTVAPTAPLLSRTTSAWAPPAYTPVVAATRSNGLMFIVLGLLLLGGILAYSLPAISAGRYGHDSLRNVERYYPRSWLVWLAHLGVIGAAIAALAFDTGQRRAQAWLITIGCLLSVPFLISLLAEMSKFGVPVHLGSGVWLALLCFAGAAIAPWIALKQTE